mmetsp:Transcript_68101/g.110484  ORF Transcript_68101/g.110484 Transcript_68101/m.110484 type:complete len:84 (-) Transcript_68101:178-429(-)
MEVLGKGKKYGPTPPHARTASKEEMDTRIREREEKERERKRKEKAREARRKATEGTCCFVLWERQVSSVLTKDALMSHVTHVT